VVDPPSSLYRRLAAYGSHPGATLAPDRASDLYLRIAARTHIARVNRTTGTKAVETVDIDRVGIWLSGNASRQTAEA
jgi:hypothetical protein